MSQAYAGAYNTFIPNWLASGKLITGFSRNIADFPLNQYIQITNVTQPVGPYLRLAFEQAARIVSSDGVEFYWPDGADAPQGDWSKELFDWDSYRTLRYCFGFRIGNMTVQNADWNIVAQQGAIAAQLSMTLRCLLAYNKFATSGNWLANQWYSTASAAFTGLSITGGTASATSGGGGLASGTVNNPLLKKFIQNAIIRMNKLTLGVVKAKDFKLVMSPTIAAALGVSEEIQDFIKQSPGAQDQIRGDTIGSGNWGLPRSLYGVPTCIEDTVRITARKKAIGATTPAADNDYVWGNSLALIARPGALSAAPLGTPSFSALHLMMKEDQTVETMIDTNNRRTAGRVVDEYGVQVVSTAGLFFVNSALT